MQRPRPRPRWPWPRPPNDCVVVVVIELGDGVLDTAIGKRCRHAADVHEPKRLVHPRWICRITVVLRPEPPDPVDVGVVQPEDRVLSGSVGIAHQATNGDVHVVVWSLLKSPRLTPELAERRRNAA